MNNNYGTTKHMNVIVTNQCNRKCPFCIAQKNTNKTENTFLQLKNIEKAIEFAKKENIKTIALTGGEPTLHPNIIKIAEMFHVNGFDLALYTNYDFPEIVRKLDGLVNHIFVSYYGQQVPKQSDLKKPQLIMTILLLKDYFKSMEDLDKFIENYKDDAILLFNVPVNVNDYCEEQTCDFLDEITNNNYLPMTLPDGTILQIYKGCIIKRTDLPKAFIHIDAYSYKMRLDGEISHFYSESTEEISKIENVSLRNELLSTHNSKERQKILSRYNSIK